MTKQTRCKFSAEFKAKVALEAIKNQKTMAQLSKQFDVNAITISKWKTEALEHLLMAFKRGQMSSVSESSIDAEKLYAQIGQLKVENDFLKKSARKLGINDSEWK
jgi:transposase-like protein